MLLYSNVDNVKLTDIIDIDIQYSSQYSDLSINKFRHIGLWKQTNH